MWIDWITLFDALAMLPWWMQFWGGMIFISFICGSVMLVEHILRGEWIEK